MSMLMKILQKTEDGSKEGGNQVQKLGPKQCLAISMLVGILLLVIAIPTGGKNESLAPLEDTPMSQNTDHIIEDEDYKGRMETELEELLTVVEGVGQVEVMITLATSAQKVVEKDMQTNDLDINESTIYGEEDQGSMPYVNQEIYPEIAGVIVAAQGGDNPVTIKNITDAIQALFAVDTHKIKIMKMKLDS